MIGTEELEKLKQKMLTEPGQETVNNVIDVIEKMAIGLNDLKTEADNLAVVADKAVLNASTLNTSNLAFIEVFKNMQIVLNSEFDKLPPKTALLVAELNKFVMTGTAIAAGVESKRISDMANDALISKEF